MCWLACTGPSISTFWKALSQSEHIQRSPGALEDSATVTQPLFRALFHQKTLLEACWFINPFQVMKEMSWLCLSVFHTLSKKMLRNSQAKAPLSPAVSVVLLLKSQTSGKRWVWPVSSTPFNPPRTDRGPFFCLVLFTSAQILRIPWFSP